MTYDPWDFETGGKEEFTLTIDTAVFTFDSTYNQGQTVVLKFEGNDDEGDEQRIFYALGPGWEPVDGGKRVIREDGGEGRRFNRNSQVAKALAAAMETGAPIKERGTPMESSIWPGLRFKFKRTKLNEGGQFETSRMLPVEFLGVVGNGSGTAPQSPATAATATAANITSAPATTTGGNKVGMAKLKAAAKRAPDFDSFIEEGLAIADGDAALEALVADEAFYTEHHA